MEVIAIDHVHFYLTEITSWRRCLENVWQFQTIAEYTEQSNKTVVLSQNNITFYLSTPLNKASSVAHYLNKHSEGLAEIGFLCTRSLPSVTINNIRHHFLTKPSYSYQQTSEKSLVNHIDHIVVNVPHGQMLSTAQWYAENMQLQCGDRFVIASDHSGLHSLVMHNSNHQVQIPINQPADPNSQIQDFLDIHGGAGIQHLALATRDIGAVVAHLEKSGVKFLATEPKILVEQQGDSALLQIFTQPIFAQPTFFLEIIERRQGAKGFGERNFQALFNAVETAQRLRQS